MPKTNALLMPPLLRPEGNNWRSDSIINGFTVVAIPIFEDNYIWLLHNNEQAWVFDPGQAEPIIRYLSDHALTLVGVLITHSHWDHVSGIAELVQSHPAPVYGPNGIHSAIDQPVSQGDTIQLGQLTLNVHETPGHMAEHLSYHSPAQALLFCGDTLFSAGCGRLKQTGNMTALYHSIAWMKSLPPETYVFCSHEYTLANLLFAAAVEPSNTDVKAYQRAISQLRECHQPSLPSRLATELKINPFLRLPCESPLLNGQQGDEPMAVFQALRTAKDHF